MKQLVIVVHHCDRVNLLACLYFPDNFVQFLYVPLINGPWCLPSQMLELILLSLLTLDRTCPFARVLFKSCAVVVVDLVRQLLRISSSQVLVNNYFTEAIEHLTDPRLMFQSCLGVRT